jgi:hypothetical protein
MPLFNAWPGIISSSMRNGQMIKKKVTYFLSKSNFIIGTLSGFEIGWQDKKLGVKVVRPRRGA